MDVIQKLASSLDDAINLVLGGDTKRPIDVCCERYHFFTRF